MITAVVFFFNELTAAHSKTSLNQFADSFAVGMETGTGNLGRLGTLYSCGQRDRSTLS